MSDADKNNHYVSVEGHNNLIKGYVALEGKSFVAIDDFKVNQGPDNIRRIIKPVINTPYRISASSEGTNRLCFTANANYDKKDTSNSRDSREQNKNILIRDSGFK